MWYSVLVHLDDCCCCFCCGGVGGNGGDGSCYEKWLLSAEICESRIRVKYMPFKRFFFLQCLQGSKWQQPNKSHIYRTYNIYVIMLLLVSPRYKKVADVKMRRVHANQPICVENTHVFNTCVWMKLDQMATTMAFWLHFFFLFVLCVFFHFLSVFISVSIAFNCHFQWHTHTHTICTHKVIWQSRNSNHILGIVIVDCGVSLNSVCVLVVVVSVSCSLHLVRLHHNIITIQINK